MTITLRSLRAVLNAANPRESAPRARVAKARDRLERRRANGAPPEMLDEQAARVERYSAAADLIDANRVRARLLVEDAGAEIAALFGVSPGRFAERLEERARENLERKPDADEAEIWRDLLGSLLTTCEARLEAQAPETPTIVSAQAAAQAFLAAPSLATLLHLADTARAAEAPGAPWRQIAKFARLAPSGAEVRTIPYGIEIRWRGARYRFGTTGHADDGLGITSGG